MNVRKVPRWLPLLALLACHERRELAEDANTFDRVAPLLERACLGCHALPAAAGYSLSTYYDAIGCTDAGQRATEPADASAPILSVLARADHAALLSEAERALLERWVSAGTPGRRGSVHPSGILEPDSASWHGKLAAADGFAALRDAAAPHVCGRCHDGAPVRPSNVRFAAPGAPACTSCHSEPGASLSCTTCHGSAGHAYPPRDGCHFPAQGAPDKHAAHLEPTRFRQLPLVCADCHPTPDPGVFSGVHANGVLDLQLPAQRSGASGQYDPSTGSCSVACHARGGDAETPRWHDQLALDCNSCHLSPPSAHYAGPCASCHAEMGATAASLTPGPLHLDGRVELGNGDGSCGACHGQAEDAWPRDALHRAHRDSTLTAPIDCTSCHAVPAALHAPGHLDGHVTVRFDGRALARNVAPVYDPQTKSCSAVACHGSGLRDAAPAPAWNDSELTLARCDGCHLTPPSAPHVQQAHSCAGALCHQAEVTFQGSELDISRSGRALHIDGVLESQ